MCRFKTNIDNGNKYNIVKDIKYTISNYLMKRRIDYEKSQSNATCRKN